MATSPPGQLPKFRRAWILQDSRSNMHRPRARLLLALFRLAQAARFPFDKRPSALAILLTAVYVFVSEWLLGMELPVKTTVGPRLQIVHGYGLVVNVDSILGSDVVIRQAVTIGNKGDGGESPSIGDRVTFGAGACVLGGIEIGHDAKVGANAVVLINVPPGRTVVGNPGRLRSPRQS